MAFIEIQSFFYDLIHCKEKILTVFSEWDEQYGEDERGALVAGISNRKSASGTEAMQLQALFAELGGELQN